jgi:hypothetical protein
MKDTVIVGDIFGKRTVIKITSKRRPTDKANKRYYTVKCECGNIAELNLPTLRASKSCGCAKVKHGRSQTPEYWMYKSAERRAKEQGVPFTIELDDIVISERCPLLDIPLFVGSKTCADNSPTLDKLIPHLGYVPGNVLVISDKANRIKSNASLDEIMLLADNLHKVLVSIPA